MSLQTTFRARHLTADTTESRRVCQSTIQAPSGRQTADLIKRMCASFRLMLRLYMERSQRQLRRNPQNTNGAAWYGQTLGSSAMENGRSLRFKMVASNVQHSEGSA